MPTDENELHQVMIFWNMKERVRADEKIRSVNDINDEGLRLIYEEKTDEAMDLIQTNFIKNKWASDFQFDLLMYFWFAVYTENPHLVTRILEFDIYLRQLVTLAMKGSAEKPHRFKQRKFMRVADYPKMVEEFVDKTIVEGEPGDASEIKDD
jgi:hypothetical protein